MAVGAFAILCTYNYAMWVFLLSSVDNCDNSCKTTLQMSGTIYMVFMCLFSIFIGALAYNTIWRCAAPCIAVLSMICMPFLMPMSTIGATIMLAILMFAIACNYLGTAITMD